MSQVKEINIKILNFERSETCLNFSNCYSIQNLNFDIGIPSYKKFHIIIRNYFNKGTDISLPKIFKEQTSDYDEPDSFNVTES